MLTIQIEQTSGIAMFEPHGALSKAYFKSAAQIVDGYIEQYEKLNGLIIHTRSFLGWDSFGALVSHLEFVKDHHKK